MDVGIGLPNGIPGTEGRKLVEWARRSERRGFTTLGAIDRLAYENYEPLIALSAAAAVTERIGLCTSALLMPLRANASALAKQALSLQALSDGRLVLGVGIGERETDFEVAAASMARRGVVIDGMLARMQELWEGGEIGPSTSPPAVLVGGRVDASFERGARFGAGWIAGGVAPEEFATLAKKARAAWRRAGREESPRLVAAVYHSLGDDPSGGAYLRDYYAWLGQDAARGIAAHTPKDADAVRDCSASFEAAGCDELIFLPCTNDPDEVDRLADAIRL